MFGYSLQLDDSDVIYNLAHDKVLDDHFNPKWIVDQMINATYCHERNSDWSPNVPRVEERVDESSRQVDYLSVARWPDQ